MRASLDINSLFQAAQSRGARSAVPMPALTSADMGAMIQIGLGPPVDDVTASAADLGGGWGALTPSSLWR
ncbi:MAG TPA: hypothetical protein VI542_33715 [Candidatus Tectomicrobia bacterium]